MGHLLKMMNRDYTMDKVKSLYLQNMTKEQP